jgi:putative FmdB family regulatory protein
MTSYVYRCADHGPVEVAAPMGTAPASVPCPACDAPARRVFTAPRLSFGSASHRALLHQTEATADSPAVVDRPPAGRPARTAPANPALARLPRP